MSDTTDQIAAALMAARCAGLILAGYCQASEERYGDPVPLDLPVELRARMQLLIDACADADEEAMKAKAIGMEH